MDGKITLTLDLSNGADKGDAGLQTRARLLEFIAINGLTDEIYSYTEEGHALAGPDKLPLSEDEKILAVVEKIITRTIMNAVAQKRADTAARKARDKTLLQEGGGR